MNTISGLFDVNDDPPMRYGFIVICSDSAAFGIREKFVKLIFCYFMLLKVIWKWYFILQLSRLVRMHSHHLLSWL